MELSKIKDSMEKVYLKTNSGTCYDEGTPERVIEILEDFRARNSRIRVFYGDKETGKCWEDENDVVGRIGRSNGTIKIPLLLANANSSGGGGILTACIVKIISCNTKQVLYQHPNFSQAKYTVRQSLVNSSLFEVLQNGETYAPQCKSLVSANRLADFMNGTRMSK